VTGAVVRVVDGAIVLDDPQALALVRVVGRHNCRGTLEANADRVAHFARRMAERGDSADAVLIVILNVDEPLGEFLASALMPGHDWQAYRDRGEVPFARGLAGRAGLADVLAECDTEAAQTLGATTGLAVVVVDHGAIAVFAASEVAP